MTELATTVSAANIQPIIDLVCNAVTSHHTKRAYTRSLTDFMAWYQTTGQTAFNKATVQAHVTALRDAGVSTSSVNQRITTLRKLANEMADNGLISESAAQAINRVKRVTKEGQRLGNWLTKEQAQRLLELPNVETIKGLRDRAILAVLLGAGLRREECAGVTVEHFQQREGRWVIVDLVGKRNKTRSVPVDGWVKYAVDTYCQAAAITTGPLFRAMRRGDRLQADGMTAQAIFDVVKEYAAQVGVNDLAPHDLRRTFAKLSQKGGAAIQQIQFSLGHSSVQTTERYLGTHQDLANAPSDVLGLHI